MRIPIKNLRDRDTLVAVSEDKEEKSQMQKEQSDLPFQCSFKFCGKKIKFVCLLETHLAQHDRVRYEKRFYTCRLCEKIFRWHTSLETHWLHHTKEKPFICKICDRSFSQNNYLQRHMLSHDVHESTCRLIILNLVYVIFV